MIGVNGSNLIKQKETFYVFIRAQEVARWCLIFELNEGPLVFQTSALTKTELIRLVARHQETETHKIGVVLAGGDGFEPPDAGVKFQCLTAWLTPKGKCRFIRSAQRQKL